MKKTRIEILQEIINQQEVKVVACDIDLKLYTRKSLIATADPKANAFYENKLGELKAIRKRAEETIEIANELIKEELKSDKKLAN